MVSPSASVDAVLRLQTSGSKPVSGSVGEIAMTGAVGAVFPMVTVLEFTAVPDVVPSEGVTRTYTVLPRLKYVPVSVELVAATTELFTYQAYVYVTVSPSASDEVGVAVMVLASYTSVGEVETDEITGAVFDTVTVLELTALLDVVPSLAVTLQ